MENMFGERLKHAFNAFMNRSPTNSNNYREEGMGYSTRPDRPRMTRGNERSIITSVYNRIAMDVASMTFCHCRLDKDGRFLETIDSGLNECLTLSANIDQTSRAFMQDVVMSMLDEGCVSIIPIDTTDDPEITGAYDINSMRTGKVVQWYPSSVRVRAYNDQNGRHQELALPKQTVSVIENPLYPVMNEPNSTVQRLIRKLNLLDSIDEQSGSGKLDLIIQLPYTIRTDLKRNEAEKRRKDVEMQLNGSKYGVAYTDGTEKITQLNRPVENNLMKQIEYLTNLMYSQLGISQSVMDGTADEKTMLNYYNRTVEPIVAVIVDDMRRKFLTKTARTQRQTIMCFRDPFKLVPINDIAEIADKFTRNEIMSSNEIRQKIGMKPSSDPKADQLINSNINQAGNGEVPPSPGTSPESSQNGEQTPVMTESEYLSSVKDLDDIDEELDALEVEFNEGLNVGSLAHYASPYYDKEKAHEYYMRNRELKGRKSTAKLNEQGKAAAQNVKENLTAEKKVKVEAERTSYRETVEQHKLESSSKIKALRNRLKGLTKQQKAAISDEIYDAIDQIREANKQVRDALALEFKGNKQQLNSEYDEKYVNELDKIRNTASFQKVSKRRGR